MSLRNTLDYKLLPLLDTVLVESHRHAGTLTFSKQHPQHLALISLYCTIIELASGEKALIDKGQTTGLRVLLRSIMEAYADLRALLANPGYTKRMYATFLDEKLRFMSNVARAPANPFFVGAGNMDSEKRDVEKELGELKKGGNQPLSNFARFEAGGLTDEYQSIYWLLCLESHNNMSALDDRHIEKRGEEYDVVLFKEAKPDDLVLVVDSLLAVVIEAGIRVHALLGSKAVKHFEVHKSTLDAHRADYAKAKP